MPLPLRVGRPTGTQLGLVLGWLSTRVLGQYDLLLTDEALEDQDLVYFVGPNIVAVETQTGSSRASSGCGWPCTR